MILWLIPLSSECNIKLLQHNYLLSFIIFQMTILLPLIQYQAITLICYSMTNIYHSSSNFNALDQPHNSRIIPDYSYKLTNNCNQSIHLYTVILRL